MADTIDVSFVPAFQNTIVPLFAEDPDGLRESVRLRTNIIGKVSAGTPTTASTGEVAS